MGYMNEYDVDDAVAIINQYATDDNIKRLAENLQNYKWWMNSVSDGWTYWTAGRKSADRAATLVEEAVTAIRKGNDSAAAITDTQYKRALATMKARITNNGGNWATIFAA